MTNEKIKNATLKTLNDVKALVKELNAESTFESVPDTLKTKVNVLNQRLTIERAKTHLTTKAVDFYAKVMLLPCKTAEECRSGLTASIARLKMSESGIHIDFEKIEKPLTFADFYTAKVELLASKHADKKATKEDRQKATAYFYGNDGYGLLQCLIHISADTNRLTEKEIEVNADMVTAYAKIKKEYESKKQVNPFDKGSNRGVAESLARVTAEFIGEFTAFQVNQYHFKAFSQIVATTTKKGFYTIENESNAMSALFMVIRHAFNNIPIEMKAKAKILK